MESLLSLLKSRWFFLKKLYQNDLPFELEHQRLLKDVMIVEAEKRLDITCENWMGRPSRLVGRLVEWSAGPVFFALNIDTPNSGRICIKRGYSAGHSYIHSSTTA